jgi:hypothetical protein
MNLTYVISSKKVEGEFSKSVYGYNLTGCCGPECYKRYWISEIKMNPTRIIQLPPLPIYTPDLFEAHLTGIMMCSNQPSSEAIAVLQKYSDRLLAQGIIMMRNGFQTLDHSKITDGLRLCRSDLFYERRARGWVDALAAHYVQDLKRMDVATSRANLGGVTVSIGVPKDQSGTRLVLCPSCGAHIDQIAIRGQSIKCGYCNSVFQIS